MAPKVRTGKKKTYFDQASLIMFSDRKRFSTKATFVSTLAFSAIGVGGVAASLTAPTMFGESSTGERVFQGLLSGGLAYYSFQASRNMAKNWWITEK